VDDDAEDDSHDMYMWSMKSEVCMKEKPDEIKHVIAIATHNSVIHAVVGYPE
jgi:hypothetical protein